MPKNRRVAIQLDLEWPYKRHAALFAGTQQYARQHGWDSIIDEFVADNLPTQRTNAIPYDGVIARATEKLASRTARLGIPLVNVWFNSPVRDDVPGVFADHAACGRLRAEHLLSRGLRRFAVVVREDRGRKLEAESFRTVVEKAGFPCDVLKTPLRQVTSHSVWLKTQQRLDAWISNWQLPMGVFATDENTGRSIVQRCARRGWRVPQDVAIIAGWNEEVLCENPQPSLSSVELGFERIGYAAARLLDQLMDTGTRRHKHKHQQTSPQHIQIPPERIVIRESTDFYAVDDETVSAALLFIAETSHKSIGPDDVAKALNLEPRTLRRRFAKVLGRTIASEICRIRFDRAKREIVQSDASLADIARDVGFASRRHMYEVFFRELGVTPREYRKQWHLVDRT